MRIMHVDASARQRGSVSRTLSARFIDKLRANGVVVEIDRIDLATTQPAHFGHQQAAAMYSPAEEYSREQAAAIAVSDSYCARLLAVDALVIGTPIYNFGMPSTLKAFVDHISRAGITFIADAAGTRGLLGRTRVACVTAFGGDYAPGAPFEGLDHLTPHLTTVLRFLGVSDLTFIAAWPTLLADPERTAAARDAAEAAVEALAWRWSAQG
jgi:FMN-dependent NADH-azoreductase